MATPVKAGGRNELFALKEARRNAKAAARSVENMVGELRRMREQSGRPNYIHIGDITNDLTLQLSYINAAVDEMWSIRQAAGQTEEKEELASRVADLESTVTLLQMMLQKGEATWTP